MPAELRDVLDKDECNVFSSNIGVVEMFRKRKIGISLYLLSLIKLVDLENGYVMELVQDESKRQSGDTKWEDSIRSDLNHRLSERNIQPALLWEGFIDTTPAKLISYRRNNY